MIGGGIIKELSLIKSIRVTERHYGKASNMERHKETLR